MVGTGTPSSSLAHPLSSRREEVTRDLDPESSLSPASPAWPSSMLAAFRGQPHQAQARPGIFWGHSCVIVQNHKEID